MSELIVIDARKEITWLDLKLSNFNFTIELTSEIRSMIYSQMFSNWRKKVKDIEEDYPSDNLLNTLEIECIYQRDYIRRTLNQFQRSINELFITHGVFDDLAIGNYNQITVHRGYLRFEPTDTLVSDARWCDGSLRFSKGNSYERERSNTEKHPNTAISPGVCAKTDIGW